MAPKAATAATSAPRARATSVAAAAQAFAPPPADRDDDGDVVADAAGADTPAPPPRTAAIVDEDDGDDAGGYEEPLPGDFASRLPRTNPFPRPPARDDAPRLFRPVGDLVFGGLSGAAAYEYAHHFSVASFLYDAAVALEEDGSPVAEYLTEVFFLSARRVDYYRVAAREGTAVAAAVYERASALGVEGLTDPAMSAGVEDFARRRTDAAVRHQASAAAFRGSSAPGLSRASSAGRAAPSSSSSSSSPSSFPPSRSNAPAGGSRRGASSGSGGTGRQGDRDRRGRSQSRAPGGASASA